MKIDTILKKITLTLFAALGGVLWLNIWHQIGHSHETIGSSPVVYWLRDSLIVLLPILLAVLIGSALLQWLGDRFSGRISPRSQTALTVAMLGVLTSTAIIMVEASRILPTGIHNDFALIVSVCRTINSSSFQFVDALFRNFSVFETARIHVILQDWSTLMLVNLAITMLSILIFTELETKAAGIPSFQLNKSSLLELAKALFSVKRRMVLVLSMALTYGGLFWMQYLHELRGIHQEQNITPILHWL
jgi:hypothetical protein